MPLSAVGLIGLDVIPWLGGGSDSLDRDPPSDGASALVPPRDWPWTLGCFSPAQIGRPASATVKEEESFCFTIKIKEIKSCYCLHLCYIGLSFNLKLLFVDKIIYKHIEHVQSLFLFASRYFVKEMVIS